MHVADGHFDPEDDLIKSKTFGFSLKYGQACITPSALLLNFKNKNVRMFSFNEVSQTLTLIASYNRKLARLAGAEC